VSSIAFRPVIDAAGHHRIQAAVMPAGRGSLALLMRLTAILALDLAIVRDDL
jgi:hypothetical protein